MVARPLSLVFFVEQFLVRRRDLARQQAVPVVVIERRHRAVQMLDFNGVVVDRDDLEHIALGGLVPGVRVWGPRFLGHGSLFYSTLPIECLYRLGDLLLKRQRNRSLRVSLCRVAACSYTKVEGVMKPFSRDRRQRRRQDG